MLCVSVGSSNKQIPVNDTEEYFFALTPDPAPPTYATWTNSTVTHFVSECPEVAASVVYGKTMGVNASVPATYQKEVSTIKQVAFWQFDDDGAVLKFDAWIPTLQKWWNTTHDVAHFPVNEALVRSQLCQATQAMVSSSLPAAIVKRCVLFHSPLPGENANG